MKKTITPAVVFFLLSAGLFSCTKDHGPKPIPPVSGNLTLDLSYPDSSKTLSNYELIINEPGGKIVLDTQMAFNTTLSTTLSSDAPLVDLTTITYNQGYQNPYFVTSYRGVNPRTWSSLQPMNFGSIQRPTPYVTSSPASIVYTNPPALTGNVYDYSVLQMSNYASPNAVVECYIPNSGINYQPGTSLSINYYEEGTNDVYLLFPQLGLYNIHPWHSANDIVDLSHMDTAAKIIYAKPPLMSVGLSLLRGFFDTANNLANTAELFSGSYGADYDLLYPPKGVQLYELLTFTSNLSEESYLFYSYGPTVPTSLPFPTSPSYTVLANQPDNFSVQFPGIRPSNYEVTCVGDSVTLYVLASPDSTVQHPITLLNGLNSKMLHGQGYANVATQTFTWDLYPGLDYAGGYNYFFNPGVWSKIRLNGSTSFSKGFQ